MKITRSSLLLSILWVLAASPQAQVSEKSADSTTDAFQRQILRNNAIDLAAGIGKQASDLTDLNDRITIRLNAATVLRKYDLGTSIQLLEMAWDDAGSDPAKANSQRQKILTVAAKIDPEKAKKWLKEMTADKPADANSEKDPPQLSAKQKADLILRSALADVAVRPEEATKVAISSLYQTGAISSGFGVFVDAVSALPRADLAGQVYANIVHFVKDRRSSDESEFAAVRSLLANKSASQENKNRLLDFLLNSGRQIVVTQNANQAVGKLSVDEMLFIYRGFVLMLRPYIQAFMLERLGELDSLIQDLAVFVSPDQLSNPLLSPYSADKQIEDAERVAGSKQRDIRFMKIASWLLSRRKRLEPGSLKLAATIADRISDDQTKTDIRDFIKIVLIERSVADKNLDEAERIADSITSAAIKGWAFMGLGLLEAPISRAVSLRLFDSAQAALQKSSATAYRIQTTFELSAALVDRDESRSLDVLDDAARFASKNGEPEAKVFGELVFFSSLGEANFDSTDLSLTADEIDLPTNLGKLAVGHWNSMMDLSKQFRPLRTQLEFQLILANAALDHCARFDKKSNDGLRVP